MTMLVSAAMAQDNFPSRPCAWSSPSPGRRRGLTARTVGQKMGELLGQPVVVENKPGANGTLGCEAVAKAAADGYTMLETDRGALGVNPSLYKKLPYDSLRDFEYVGIVTSAPYVLVIDPKLRRSRSPSSRRSRSRSPARSTTAATASPAWRSSTSRR